MTKRFKILSVVVAVILLTLITLSFFYDLNISKSLVVDGNFFSKLGKAFGSLPIFVGPILFGLVYGFTNDGKWKKILPHLLGLAGSYLMSVEITKYTLRAFSGDLYYHLDWVQYLLLSISALCIYYFLFLVFSRISVDNLNKLRDISLIYLCVAAASLVTVEVAKRIWCRPRYRLVAFDETFYRNFLSINFKNFRDAAPGTDDFYSFPSGHTAYATTAMMLALIPARFTAKKWVGYLTNVLCLVFVLAVATSRVMMGEHFASDVLVGMTITLLYFWIAYVVFYKKRWLNVRSNKC